MTKEEYKKLNEYLNDCFVELEVHNSFLLRNIAPIAQLSELYVSMMEPYEFIINHSKQYLTYEEVYTLAREIIEDICPNYLEYYDQLISSGELNSEYDGEYSNSFMFVSPKKNMK